MLVLTGNTFQYRTPDSQDSLFLQLLLRANGTFQLHVDGVRGPKTVQAIQEFQAKHGIQPTGGPLTDETVEALCRGVVGPQLTPDKLNILMPTASYTTIQKFWKDLLEIMGVAEVNTPLRQAHFLAQAGHESMDLRCTEELASGQQYEGRLDLGNTQPGDGPRFKGRGLIQLTGRENYRLFGQFIQRDLLVDEAWLDVAKDTRLAVATAAWFWSGHNLNEYADRSDVLAITKRINGGTNGLADRYDRTERGKWLLGI